MSNVRLCAVENWASCLSKISVGNIFFRHRNKRSHPVYVLGSRLPRYARSPLVVNFATIKYPYYYANITDIPAQIARPLHALWWTPPSVGTHELGVTQAVIIILRLCHLVNSPCRNPAIFSALYVTHPNEEKKKKKHLINNSVWPKRIFPATI